MRSARFLLGFCCEFEIWGCVLLLSLQCRMKHRGKLGRVITAFGCTHIYTRRYIHHFYSSIIGQIFPNHWNYITHFGSLNVLKPNIDGTWYNSTHIDISFHAQICWSFWITIISTHLILQPDLSWKTSSILWLLMLWNPVSTGHLQSWCWLCRKSELSWYATGTAFWSCRFKGKITENTHLFSLPHNYLQCKWCTLFRHHHV